MKPACTEAYIGDDNDPTPVTDAKVTRRAGVYRATAVSSKGKVVKLWYRTVRGNSFWEEVR